jgi:hypothetical protein
VTNTLAYLSSTKELKTLTPVVLVTLLLVELSEIYYPYGDFQPILNFVFTPGPNFKNKSSLGRIPKDKLFGLFSRS